MKRCTEVFIIIMLMFVLAFPVACAKKGVKKDLGVTEEGAPGAIQLGEEGLEGLEDAEAGGPAWNEPTAEMAPYFNDIYFEYDRFTLTPEAKETLNKMGEYLLKNTSIEVLVEGHCDERGTAEYNLALGERRAHSAKQYLAQLGIEDSRISTISFGEERPLDPGHSEQAWAKNRRCHFLYR